MQAAQDHDRCTGIHPQDKTRRKAPAEIYFAMRNHIRINFRVGGVGPAHMGFRYVHIADIGKALGAQQFLKNLRGDAGPGVLSEADRGDF